MQTFKTFNNVHDKERSCKDTRTIDVRLDNFWKIKQTLMYFNKTNTLKTMFLPRKISTIDQITSLFKAETKHEYIKMKT